MLSGSPYDLVSEWTAKRRWEKDLLMFPDDERVDYLDVARALPALDPQIAIICAQSLAGRVWGGALRPMNRLQQWLVASMTEARPVDWRGKPPGGRHMRAFGKLIFE